MKKLIPVYVRFPLIYFSVMLALEYFIDSGDKPAFIKYPMVGLFLLVFAFLLIAFEITSSAVDKVTYHLMTDEQRKELDSATGWSIESSKLYQTVKRWMIGRKREENDEAIMMDHNYDGIRELDNKLPPWWVYLFYVTIIFSVIYLVRYEIMGADGQEEELRKEMAAAKIAVEEYKKTAPDQMDAEKATVLTDDASLAAGKAIYDANCMACHRADGGGQIGPNLTDDHWILGGGIKNVFHTIANGGRDGKGMVAWNATLKPTQIQQVSSYIISLHGTNPKDAKAPEGEIWQEAASDSTKVAAAN